MTITINRAAFRDKVHACWIGKNIGGTMGAPYEGTTCCPVVTGFKNPAGSVLPNDDLDLQLVWLLAVEQEGLHGLDARVLGEYWLSYITPHWNEYGIGKANMRSGLQAPLSGDQDNDWRDSNGAWIRSEIWASLFPGRPDLAASYALEDASVDHGCGEGTYAAVFTAAMQSAAYVLSDVRDCITAALGKLPPECRVARSVRMAIEGYESGLSPQETRNRIQTANADIGNGWFEAPSNVGYTVIGLVYGEGDYKKSMLTAIGCGDDTDCTAATVGATLGILGGTAAIPADWRAYVGDSIQTISIDRATCWRIPATCSELTDRVVRLTGAAAGIPIESPYYHQPFETVEWTDDPVPPANAAALLEEYAACPLLTDKLNARLPYTVTDNFLFARASLSVPGGVNLAPGQDKTLTLTVTANTNRLGNIPYRLSLRFWTPDGMTVTGPSSLFLPAVERHTDGRAHASFVLHTDASALLPASVRIVLEITAEGRAEAGYLTVVMRG